MATSEKKIQPIAQQLCDSCLQNTLGFVQKNSYVHSTMCKLLPFLARLKIRKENILSMKIRANDSDLKEAERFGSFL